jgi:hypothetical protein
MKQETIFVASRPDGDGTVQAVEVPGYVVTPVFAVNHPVSDLSQTGLGSGWNVTHLPTGMSAGTLPKRNLAVGLAEVLSKIKGAKKGKFGRPEYLTKKVLKPMGEAKQRFLDENGIDRWGH